MKRLEPSALPLAPLLLAPALLLFMLLALPAQARRPGRRSVPPSSASATIEEGAESPSATGPQFAANGAPIIHGKCAILVDTRTGRVLWEKNARFRRPMASLTKVMTTLLILESGRLDDVVTASKNANETQYSSMYLAVGEKVTLRDLLWAILLRSANDACVAAAEHLGGTVPRFVARMNRRAQQLGLKDTHFVTPNGLNAPGHYSTAADLARITLEDMKYPLFNEMVRTKKHIIERSIRKGNATMVSRSRILWKWPLADGVKTGYTKQAGHCFIGSATKDGWRLLSVVLNSPHVGDDTRAVLTYGFRRFRSVQLGRAGVPLATLPVRMGTRKTVTLGLKSNLYATLGPNAAAPKGPSFVALPKTLNAPVRAGATVAEAVWNGPENHPLAEASLVALTSAPMKPVAAAAARVGWWPPLALALLAFGAIKYGSSAKDHRQRGRGAPKSGRRVGRRR